MAKNILFVFNIYPGCGGLESVSNNIIEYLSQKHSIYTVSISMQEVTAPMSIKKMYLFDNIKNKKRCIELINHIIETHDIDCIINQGIYPKISSILFNRSRLLGPKVFSFLHGMPKYEEHQCRQQMNSASTFKQIKYKFLDKIGLYHKYERYLKRFSDSYRKAYFLGDKIVLLCKDYIEPFKKAYQLEGDNGKIIAIENPLSVEFSTQETVAWGSKKNIVLFVGRISAEKRVDIVLDVWSRIQNQTDWELVIVGDGVYWEQLHEIVRVNQIERVSFTGQLDSVVEQYVKAKIILLTSSHEGFPMCLNEAKRFGVVPITFQTSDGVKSVVGDGGVLVPQDNRVAMAEQLIRLINNDDELFTLSCKARDGSEKYKIDVIAKRWDELINK